MNERNALLVAILADPFDTTPRLVFADWLREHDEQDRADFIQLQVNVEKHRNERGDVDLGQDHPDVRRVTELWEVQEREWLAVLPGEPIDLQLDFRALFTIDRDRVLYLFRSGFPFQVLLTLQQFTDDFCRRLFQVAPVIHVSLTDRWPASEGLPGYAWLESSTWQEIQDGLPPELFWEFWEYGILQPEQPAEWSTGSEAAIALSRLCVNHGRKLVGLPPLKWPSI
jgi:uncharacterized protein (TIGR02996 family)